jgi:hypothetical protein
MKLIDFNQPHPRNMREEHSISWYTNEISNLTGIAELVRYEIEEWLFDNYVRYVRDYR